ncbi:MAG: multicopper polyphenol oxidase [Burkholderiaceae bacterium]|jgi:YfiH family protein|nr:MAG: multicopper polyphenol oxidase [Burkholderiaceae bacterium]
MPNPEPAGLPHDWIVPDWPVPPRVRALCTTRGGGVSNAPYASLNLGDHVGDDPAAVQENRRRFAQAIGAHPVFLRQVHGWQVAALALQDARTADGAVADGCVSAASSVACTILVADCLPVLLTDRSARAVAAAHAGWRGLAGAGGTGVLEATVGALRDALARDGGGRGADIELLAWLGPCIGPERFEVGAEVKAAFEAHDPAATACFRPGRTSRWLADLPGLARQRLGALGVTSVYGNDGSAGWCTVGNPARFHSYRRDQASEGGSGRMAACIWLA